MRCRIARDNLSRHIDGLGTPEQRATLDAHIASCPTCRQAMDELLAVHSTLKSVREVPVPHDLASRMVSVARPALAAMAADAEAGSRRLLDLDVSWLPAGWLARLGAAVAAVAVLVAGGLAGMDAGGILKSPTATNASLQDSPTAADDWLVGDAFELAPEGSPAAILAELESDTEVNR